MNIDKVNDYFERLAQATIRYKILVLIAIFAVSGFFVAHIPKMRVDTSFESFFLEEDKAIVDYNNFKKEFGNDKTVYILVEPKKGELFTLKNMKILKKITADLEQNVPYLDEVISITNVEFIEGKENTLMVYDLMEDFPETKEELLDIKRKVLDRDIYLNSVISKDGEKTGILVRLKLAEEDPDYEKKVAKKIREIFNKNEYQQAFNLYEVGSVVFDTEFQTNVRKETKKFFRLTLLAIIGLLFFFLRRAYAIYIPILVVLFSAGATFGLLAMTTSMKITSVVILPLIVTIGICDSVYIISMFQKNLIGLRDRKEAIIKTIKHCGLPCFMTSATTVVGFMSLAVVPIIPIREAGLFCAFGTAMCFLLTMTLGVILLSIGKGASSKDLVKNKGSNDFYDKIMMKITDINKKGKFVILILAGIISIIAIYEISNIVIDNNFVDYMGDKFEVKKDTLYVDNQMGGSSSFEIVFDTGKRDGIKEPQVLHEIEKVQNFVEQEKLVMTTSSVVDVIKTINKTLHNERQEYYKLPDSKNEVAQYLFLYEASGGERLDKVVNFDYSKARLVVRTKSIGSRDALKIYNHIKDFTERHVKRSKVTITGAQAIHARCINYILSGQVKSVSIAFVVICIMMMLIFGSVRVGLISMIPNIFPILFVLGFMGITGRNLGMANAMLASIAIGIAVDDTIHFFSHYRMIRRGLKPVDDVKALYVTLSEVGRPMFFTTVALAIGFSMVSLSCMKNVAEFGILATITILVALLSDLFIGSSLILTLKPWKK